MSGAVKKVGRAMVGLVMLGGGALVVWNLFGMGPYGDTCAHSIGCRSFLCLEHTQVGDAQVASDGHCTKACSADGECGSGSVCATLGGPARDDLPPFGKPDKACMVVRSVAQ